jgi:hypothetical protein
MDIQAEKLNLIKWLTEINEPSVIKRFIALKKRQQADWWDQISSQERAELKRVCRRQIMECLKSMKTL